MVSGRGKWNDDWVELEMQNSWSETRPDRFCITINSVSSVPWVNSTSHQPWMLRHYVRITFNSNVISE